VYIVCLFWVVRDDALHFLLYSHVLVYPFFNERIDEQFLFLFFSERSIYFGVNLSDLIFGGRTGIGNRNGSFRNTRHAQLICFGNVAYVFLMLLYNY